MATELEMLDALTAAVKDLPADREFGRVTLRLRA